MPMVRSPCTLEWPAHRAQAGAGLADVALQERDVGELLDRGDRVAVLGDAHRPAGDGGRRVAEHLRGALDWSRREAGGPLDGGPVDVAHVRRPVVEADGVPLDEVAVDVAPLRAAAPPIACNSARSPLTRTGRCRSASVVPTPLRPRGFCGLRNRTNPASLSGLTARIRAPLLLRLLEGGQHPRVVGARVLPHDHDQLGAVEVVEADAALADPDRPRRARSTSTRGTCWSSRAGCWCRTPARTAGRRRRPRWRSVPRCRTPPGRASRSLSWSADQPEGVVPRDRLVVRRPRAA